MRLNDNYLVTKWENGVTLKNFFINHQLDPKAMRLGKMELTDEQMLLRAAHARMMIDSPRDQRIYFITPNAQLEASRIAEKKKIDTKWFNQIEDKTCIYVTGRDSFYKFIKKATGISLIYFYLYGERKEPRYQSFHVPLDGRTYEPHEWQDPTIVDRFFNILLFVELGEVETVHVKPSEKKKWGKGGDDKLFNEAGLAGVYYVTPNYNKITIVDGGFVVSSHWRVQPYDSRSNPKYKLKQIPEYSKSGIIHRKK